MSTTTLSAQSSNSEADVARRGRVAILAIGDLIALLLFVVNGRAAHHESEAIGEVIKTALPFVVAWFVVAPFAGAYGRAGSAATTAPARLLPRTAISWIVAWPVALALRALLGGGLTVAFALIALLINAVFLLVWRAIASFVFWRH